MNAAETNYIQTRGPLVSQKQKEMWDYLQDEIAYNEAIQKFKRNPRAVEILTILKQATESAIHRMEK